REPGGGGQVRADLLVQRRQRRPGGRQLDRVQERTRRFEEVAEPVGREVEAVGQPALPGRLAERLRARAALRGHPRLAPRPAPRGPPAPRRAPPPPPRGGRGGAPPTGRPPGGPGNAEPAGS